VSRFGRDRCISILLSYGAKLGVKDKDGNTAIHLCCLGQSITTLRLLLAVLDKWRNHSLRLLCSKNVNGHTPLHLACLLGNESFVDELLAAAPTAAFKAMHATDANGMTPLLLAVDGCAKSVVMALLVWNANASRVQHKKKFGSPEEFSINSICPLSLAARKGDLEMVHVLLEAGNSATGTSAASFQFDYALHVVIEVNQPSTVRHDMVRVLIDAGANPCSVIPNLRYEKEMGFSVTSSAVISLVVQGDVEGLQIAIDAYYSALAALRYQRRNDVLLRDRPVSCFRSLEEKEQARVDAVIQDALVTSLFLRWKDCLNPYIAFPSSRLRSSMFLMNRGAKLDESSFNQLSTCLSRATGNSFFRFDQVKLECEASYFHPTPKTDQKSTAHHSSRHNSLSYWSRMLIRMDWVRKQDGSSRGEAHCAWQRQNAPKKSLSLVPEDRSDVCILKVEDRHLLAHGKILSTKRKKLAAAIRFSSFCTQDANKSSNVEIELDIRLKMACLLIQHCYHGSIVTGLSKNRRECCQELMELALIAEEYLCPSLLAKCEMRLLSARPNTCFYWCCCESIVKASETAHDDYELDLFSEFVECSYSISSSAILVNIDIAIDLVAATVETTVFL